MGKAEAQRDGREIDFAAEGSDVVLRLWPSGWEEELVLAGVVRWARGDGMGVEFTSVGPRESQAITRLVARFADGPSVRAL